MARPEPHTGQGFVVQNITEALGPNKAIELDPATGAITLLDSERGVTLSAVEVLVMTGFLAQYQDIIGLSAFMDMDARRGDDR